MNAGNGGPTRQDSYFLSPFMPKTVEMALPVPTKTFLSRSPDTAMLFAPSGCTHPPPPVPPFLLSQNLSPKDIAGCDIMKLKVSRCRYATLGIKGLKQTNTPETFYQRERVLCRPSVYSQTEAAKTLNLREAMVSKDAWLPELTVSMHASCAPPYKRAKAFFYLYKISPDGQDWQGSN